MKLKIEKNKKLTLTDDGKPVDFGDSLTVFFTANARTDSGAIAEWTGPDGQRKTGLIDVIEAPVSAPEPEAKNSLKPIKPQTDEPVGK